MNFAKNGVLYALLSLLVLFLPVLIQGQLAMPAAVEQNLYRLPYFFFFIGLILCWLFYNSREFNLILILGICFWSIQNILWESTLPTTQKIILFDMLCVFIPLNFVIFNFLKERGILNAHGLKRLFFVLIQVAFISWLVISQKSFISNYLDIEIYSHYRSTIKQPVLVIIAIFLFILISDWVVRGSQLRYAWILILAAILMGLHHINDKQITNIYFLLAAIITITAIIIHSYNMAYKDELTQLPSRRALKQKLASLGKNYAIAMTDVDHFKKLNDNYGHDVGDDVLKMLARHLSEVEGGGKAYRYGGEEFTIVFPGKDAKTAAVYLEALRTKIDSSPFIIRHKKRPRKKPESTSNHSGTQKLNVTVSIGVANKNDGHATPQDVMKSADKALYKAKKSGRNQVAIS